jgi:tRNA A-37 threonylcarbamoyl transferase component Bud32
MVGIEADKSPAGGLATAMSEKRTNGERRNASDAGRFGPDAPELLDIEDGTIWMRDAEGSELADLRTAQREAAETLVEMGATCSAASSMEGSAQPFATMRVGSSSL